jgi:DNA-binding NarL/FixJ family response regulator
VARAKARQTLVSCALGASMSYPDAVGQYELALADAHSDDATCALIHLETAEVCTAMCRLDEGLAHLALAREFVDRAGSADLHIAVLSETGFAECMLGRGVTDNAVRAFSDWDPTAAWQVGYTPRLALACARLHATEFAEAERLLADELRFAEEHGLETNEVAARGHLAEAQLRSGKWSLALENARLAVEHARQAANGQVLAGVTYPLAAVEALLGRHERARALSSEALGGAEATGDFWFIVSHRSVLGLVAFAEDEPLTAIELLQPAWKLMLERRLGDLSIFPVAQVLAEAYTVVGRFAEAAAVVAALRTSPISTLPWCRTMASRCSALVASADGDHDAARAAIEAALEAQLDLPEPFELARTRLLQGRVERNARNWGAARVAFVSALEQFDTLGAARWAEKAAAEIARLPGRRPGRSDELTTREREIALLVADGLANKEVAAKLFVTTRTVEANLSKVYAKLGLRSRTELAARFGGRQGA